MDTYRASSKSLTNSDHNSYHGHGMVIDDGHKSHNHFANCGNARKTFKCLIHKDQTFYIQDGKVAYLTYLIMYIKSI